MKKSILLLVILTAIFTSCQKFDTVVEDKSNLTDQATIENMVTDMSSLTISDSFDWKLIKTLEVEIILPENDASRILYIYSGDGTKLYFKGHSEDNSNVLKTKITIPTYENALILKYGIGTDYSEVGTSLNGKNLNFSFINNLKEGVAEDCDGDGDNNVSIFDGFKFQFDGMTENINGTSTWTYTVTGMGAPHDLSHWVLGLCEDHTVLGAIPGGWEVNTDPTTEVYGIKWDEEINKNGGSMTFSFTLDEQYNIEPVTVAFKASNENFYCSINGPSCEGGDPDPDPDPDLTGTIAFEDLWPGQGDYDINDLVIEYDFQINKDNNEYVESIEATFEIRAFGAGLHNGFGFTFPNINPTDIVSVTGYDIANSAVYNLAANGTENGQSDATFILYDDTYRLMLHPGSGIGVNTDYPAPYVTPATLVLTIEFAEDAVTYSQLDIGNFNPFIVVNQTRGLEVHLPDYPPTDLHDPSYFGTFEDDTNPPSKYYMTENNLPWAINIPAQFDYPVERQIILGAYYHFAEWAESNGTTYADWYKDLPGYRNASVIY